LPRCGFLLEIGKGQAKLQGAADGQVEMQPTGFAEGIFGGFAAQFGAGGEEDRVVHFPAADGNGALHHAAGGGARKDRVGHHRAGGGPHQRIGVDLVPAADGGEVFAEPDIDAVGQGVIEVETLECQKTFFVGAAVAGGEALFQVGLGEELPAPGAFPPHHQTEVVGGEARIAAAHVVVAGRGVAAYREAGIPDGQAATEFVVADQDGVAAAIVGVDPLCCQQEKGRT
jgi:hypothetical protein